MFYDNGRQRTKVAKVSKDNCVQAQERNEARPRHVVEDSNCKYSFSPSGQCYIEYEGPKRPGVVTGKL